MKTSILKSVLGSAAVLALPLGAWAAEGGQSLSLADTGGPSAPGLSLPAPTGGIVVQDGAAYIVHRLQHEMSLPDGSKMQPNGMLIGSDGASRSVGDGKMLTLDGQVTPAPFGTSSGGFGLGTGLGGEIGLGRSTDRGATSGYNPGVPFGSGSTPEMSAGFPNTEGSSSDPGSFSGPSPAPAAPSIPSGDPTRDSELTD